MSQKRKDRPLIPAAVTATPTPTAAPEPPPPDAPAAKPDHKGLIWRALGGAVVAAIIFLGVAVYQQLQAQLRELRGELGSISKDARRDLAALGERHAGLTKRADHDARVRLIWDAVKELRNDRSDLGRLKERCGLLLDLYKAGEDERRALVGDVRRLSEKKAGDDGQALVREIRALRERIAQLEGAPKGKLTPASHADGP